MSEHYVLSNPKEKGVKCASIDVFNDSVSAHVEARFRSYYETFKTVKTAKLKIAEAMFSNPDINPIWTKV